jgi:hypothetical protein
MNPGNRAGSNPGDRLRREEPCGRSGRLTPLCAMLDELERSALAELERTLRAELAPCESPAERRWRRLGFLARLLEGKFPTLLGYPDIERKRYDELRPEEAPRSARLVEEFGSWKKVCKAAYGLQPEGHVIYPGRPWVVTRPGAPKRPAYTWEEVFAAIKQCEKELGRGFPSSSMYQRWAWKKRRIARRAGSSLRIPDFTTVYRILRGRGWASIRRAALDREGLE